MLKINYMYRLSTNLSFPAKLETTDSRLHYLVFWPTLAVFFEQIMDHPLHKIPVQLYDSVEYKMVECI